MTARRHRRASDEHRLAVGLAVATVVSMPVWFGGWMFVHWCFQ